jgi:hypothetical protein
LLNLAKGFDLGIAKLLAKFDAISLLMLFRHFTTYWNPTSAHYTSSLIGRLPATDAFCGREKFTTAHECPLHISTEGSLPRFIGLRGKEEGSILFEHTTYM